MPLKFSRVLFLGFFLCLIGGCAAVPVVQGERCPAGAAGCRDLFSSATLASPRERFTQHFETIAKATEKASNSEEMIDALLTDDVRTAAMRLQGLGRLYQNIFTKDDRESGKKQLRKVKDFEGLLGEGLRYEELWDRVKDSRILSEKVMKAFVRRRQKTRKDLRRGLEELGWLPDPARRARKLEKTLDENAFGSLTQDKLNLLSSLITNVESIREETADLDRYFQGRHFDFDALEGGLHSWRRKLRWVIMMMVSMDGVIKLDPPEPGDAEFETYRPKVKAKYVPGGPTLDNPVVVSAKLVYEIGYMTTVLGDLKDYKESQIDLANFLLEEGFSKNEKKALRLAEEVVKEKLGFIPVEDRARELYQNYKARDPVGHLLNQLRSERARLLRESADFSKLRRTAPFSADLSAEYDLPVAQAGLEIPEKRLNWV